MTQSHASEIRVQSILDDFLCKNRPSYEDLPREIREVLAQIHLSLFDLELNVRSLKSCCRIRDNNVSSRFRYLMGMTIKQYVEGLRMEAAGRLLRSDDVGIFDASIAVGYNSLQTFYRAFGRHYGCTPAEYRRTLSNIRPFSEDKKGRCAGVDA
ncbi:MAG TPA: helix-turn-helix transcriptional regulator [Thermoanaerobaculia bacterium]|jgi:AraC-like DNA-binding protein|nr:helix-turn-helix transcriptional regulator [Thermoanaerobaculia bacterium]